MQHTTLSAILSLNWATVSSSGTENCLVWPSKVLTEISNILTYTNLKVEGDKYLLYLVGIKQSSKYQTKALSQAFIKKRISQKRSGSR